jgi:hypothetical protein
VGATTRQTMADRPVTCNACNNGGFVRFLLLQVDGIFPKIRCNLKPKGESRAFLRTFPGVSEASISVTLNVGIYRPPKGAKARLRQIVPPPRRCPTWRGKQTLTA